MTTVYRSKVDAWLVAILAIAMASSLLGAITTFSTQTPATWVLAAFIAVVGVGLPLWLLLSTHYTLGNGQLLVQSGPFQWRIPLADIKSITPSNSSLSSPALSMDRLRIDYGRYSSLMVSPRDKNQFVRDIEAARHGAN